MTTLIFAAKDKKGQTAYLSTLFLKHIESKQVVYCDKLTKRDHKKILNSDKIIIFTPTYWFGVPARLQTLIEDLACYEEEKYNFLEGKKFACVAYSPHGGDTECITKLGLVFNGWGCEIVSCGMQYYRSISEFHKDHWNLKDLICLAGKFNK